MQNDLKVYYRISSAGNPLGRMELKGTGLEIITRKKCFNTVVNAFGVDSLIVTADNANEDTINFLKSKGVKNLEITKLGNARSFKHIVQKAINESDSDNDAVLFLEDDYLCCPDVKKILLEGLEISDYCTAYDSTDKYVNASDGGNNPLIEKGGEVGRIMITKSTFWKESCATTCSFSAKIKTLKEDLPVIKYYCPDDAPHPMDYLMFRFLITQKKRVLINPLPGHFAHVGLEMGPFVSWLDLVKDME